MVAILAPTKRSQGEPTEAYVKRRMQEAKLEAETAGLWSNRVAKQILSWEAHLRRPANGGSWAAAMLEWRGARWLAAQRQGHIGSRTGTRSQPGFVCTRWHDGPDAARAWLLSHEEAAVERSRGRRHRSS